MTRGAQGDADAHADEHFVAIKLKRAPQRSVDAVGGLNRVVRGSAPLDQQGELVPSEMGQRVSSAQGGGQTPSDGHQQLVPHRVPETVVDGLEVIQVEHHQGERISFGPMSAPDSRAEPVAEQRPAWNLAAPAPCPSILDEYGPEAGGGLCGAAPRTHADPLANGCGGTHPSPLQSSVRYASQNVPPSYRRGPAS